MHTARFLVVSSALHRISKSSAVIGSGALEDCCGMCLWRAPSPTRSGEARTSKVREHYPQGLYSAEKHTTSM